MTSASELFYNRRSRLGRSSADLGLDSLHFSDRNSYQNRRYHHYFSGGGGGNHRHDSDGCDPLRRYPHARPIYRVSNQDRSAFRLDENTSQFVSSNRIDTENFISTTRPAVTTNERLPGDVLLARARLRERLRGVPPPGSRPHGRSTSIISDGGIGPDYDSRPFDAGDWDTENSTGWSIDNSPATDLSSQSARLQFLREQNEKPQGLTQEAFSCLQLELFSGKETSAGEELSRASRDCSICLESFIQGDRLICLPCEHRFHAVCLDPWVRIRGDCPYCRRVIVVKTRTMKSL